jgi:hypothetical protein
MTLEVARSFMLWFTEINYGILLYWFAMFALAHDWIHRFHGKWFLLSREQFDALHYVGLSVFKMGIILFNLVPYIALHIVG